MSENKVKILFRVPGEYMQKPDGGDDNEENGEGCAA